MTYVTSVDQDQPVPVANKMYLSGHATLKQRGIIDIDTTLYKRHVPDWIKSIHCVSNECRI